MKANMERQYYSGSDRKVTSPFLRYRCEMGCEAFLCKELTTCPICGGKIIRCVDADKWA